MGGATWILRSKRPGRRSAGSSESGMLVAPTVKTGSACTRLWLKPRVRRIFLNQPVSMFGGSICINSSLRPPVPPMAPNMPPPMAIVPPPLFERDIPMASNSSIKTTQPPYSRANLRALAYSLLIIKTSIPMNMARKLAALA